MAPQSEKISSLRFNLLLFTTWLLLILGGLGKLFIYSHTPGEGANSPSRWPTGNSPIIHDFLKPVLLIFAHPLCSCSLATIGELERLMPHLQNQVKVYVIFNQPPGRPLEWVKGDLWKKTMAIPGIHILIDQQEKESHRFQAKTSGQTLLFDQKGSLVFNGGLTSERGHMGDSAGRSFILSYLKSQKKDQKSERTSTPVFGCALKGKK